MLPVLKDQDKQENFKKVRFSRKAAKQSERKSFEPLVHDEHSMSTEKMKIPRSLYLHRKNKSNDYTNMIKVEMPTVNQILTRILNNSGSPVKARTESRMEESLIFAPKLNSSSISPSKIVLVKKKKHYSMKNHFRSASPLKAFNDRIFHLRRLIGK